MEGAYIVRLDANRDYQRSLLGMGPMGLLCISFVRSKNFHLSKIKALCEATRDKDRRGPVGRPAFRAICCFQ